MASRIALPFGLLAGILLAAQLAAGAQAAGEGWPGEWLAAGLLALLSGLALALGRARSRGSARQMLWLVAAAALVAVTGIEGVEAAFGLPYLLSGSGPAIAALLATGAALVLVLRVDPPPHRSLAFLAVGYLLQAVAVAADIGDRDVFAVPDLSAILAGELEELSELLFLAAYCVGFILFLRHLGAGSLRRAAAAPAALGARARLMFRAYGLHRAPRYPSCRLLHYPGGRTLVILGWIAWFAAIMAFRVRRGAGRPVLAQLGDLLRLGFRDGIDAITYYQLELYRPQAAADAAQCLTRYETKCGLLRTLNGLRPQAGAGGNEMTDKLLFAERCERLGIPSAPVLLLVEGGRPTWRGCGRATLDRDLFVKPRRGKGARGVMLFRRVAPELYLAPGAREMTLDEVVAKLRRASRRRSLLVQPRLRNDPEVADLACDSLVVVRVVTCLDRADEPEATHAVLRILAKLEPGWPRGPDDEHGAPIDLATGRLGPLTGDKACTCLTRLARHPVTGARVAGRRLAAWPAVRELALTAHRAFRHRVVLGWDIGLAEGGPVILEGNTNMDVAFIQRAYATPIGRSRLGELLQGHLDELCRSRDAAPG